MTRRELDRADWGYIAAALHLYHERFPNARRVRELVGEAESRRLGIEAPIRREPCAVCYMTFRVRKDGMMHRHASPEPDEAGTRRLCSGSGRPPWSRG